MNEEREQHHNQEETVLAVGPRDAGVAAAGQAAGEGSADGPSAGGGRTDDAEPATGDTSPGTTASSRGQLGAGLVPMPRVPLRDPTEAVMADPQVPEHRRFCPRCRNPVGRSTPERPGAPQGTCEACGARYSFLPRLASGDLVAERYEILGCIAYGGLGWIYLARDRHVSDEVAERWVVLKGLINSGNAAAMQTAISERRFLVEVDHPQIVKIHDFISHPDKETGEPFSYLVMEYVGGRSLRDLQREAGGVLPLAQVLAYGLEILPAFSYLHERGLLFCDFKPANLIHSEEQLKLIDLGAVRRIDDRVSTVWGTAGYQAPEVPAAGPSVASDLHTIGRTLAVLSLGIRAVDPLPDPAEAPPLAEHEPYHRWLLRATHPEPARRFGSAAEMAEQLHGVLRQVAALSGGRPRPGHSAYFGGERGVLVERPEPVAVAEALPIPLVGLTEAAAGRLDALDTLDDGDWRTDWYRGLTALTKRSPADAGAAFDRVFGVLPGELAPLMALALTAELTDDTATAERRYARVWQTDRSYVNAAFGLARLRLAAGDRDGAVRVLDEVPEGSPHHRAAATAAVRARLAAEPAALALEDLLDVSARLTRLEERREMGPRRRTRLALQLFNAALDWIGTHAEDPTVEVFGRPLTERDIRFGLEAAYRTLAKHESDMATRIELIDRANAVRPRTLL